MMAKSLLEKMEEAARRPVPYEGMRIFADNAAKRDDRAKELEQPASPKIGNRTNEAGFG
jgi:hypothetical protein